MRDEIIEVIVQQGISKDPRYSFYPYWRLGVGSKTPGEKDGYIYLVITPTRYELYKILESIFVHEYVIDRLRRKKRPDLQRYREEMFELEKNIQTKLKTFSPPEIYTRDMGLGYNEVIWSSKWVEETKKNNLLKEVMNKW